MTYFCNFVIFYNVFIIITTKNINFLTQSISIYILIYAIFLQ